ncbi:heme peroxidase [Infundibulicybe gibba]|nr:heme peroxidase [Infundibulicybe gibba]
MDSWQEVGSDYNTTSADPFSLPKSVKYKSPRAGLAFGLAADTVYLSKRPLPNAPDGRYDWEASSTGLKTEGHSGITNLINKIETITKAPVNPDPHIVGAFIDTVVHPESIDDRKGAFAAGMTALSRLPADSKVAAKMSNSAIEMLYNTIPHATSLLGPVHATRQADGGGNNLQFPDLGRAGTPYARSVQGKWCTSILPDPGLVFDTLLKARDHQAHPGGNSSLTFAFASLVTHSLFRTDFKDWNVNNTSSYLDLSPLYGYNQASQDQVRDKASGRGLLYPDTFSEERLLFLPPAASALLVILCRNHNYIADNLLKINERGRWVDPPPTDEALRVKQDEEIFQTARLVNGGHFMSLIMGDYVAGFLGLSEGNAWSMNAFDPIKGKNGIEVTRGQGNHCSVEFNVIYRWHATTSQVDEKWTEDVFNKLFKNKPFEELTLQDFGTTFPSTLGQLEEPRMRTFAGMKRGPDGKFSDDDIANILHSATGTPAGAFRARGTPAVLRVVEILGIEQARRWGVCSMNEFRKFLSLKQFESFEEWNPDPEIAGAARRLYGHIDNLELYTGLQCEATMPLSGGLRFACGYTMTRAVLSDAIALVRGDRFNTTDFTPANLTTWGYLDCQREPNNGGFGGEMPKLLMRHLPRHYPFNSVYGCFPFFTPEKMKDSLTKQGIADQYTFERPIPTRVPKVLNTLTGIKYVFTDPTRFHTVYDMKELGDGYGFILSFDEALKHDADKALALHALFPAKGSLDEYRMWYRDSVIQKIQERSWKYDGVPGNYVDIVSDVINATSVHWAADRMVKDFSFYRSYLTAWWMLVWIALEDEEQPVRIVYGAGIPSSLACMRLTTTRQFTLTFLSIGDNEHGFALRQSALQSGGVIQALIAKAILEVSPQSAPSAITSFISHVSSKIWPATEKPYFPFLSKLAETGRPLNELVAMLLVGHMFISAVHIIDLYLDEKYEKERAHISQLAQSNDPGSTEPLRGYVREAMRLNPQFTGSWRGAVVDADIPQGNGLPPLSVKAGDRIWASFKNTHLDPNEFPNPTSIDLTRPKASYNLGGTGFHKCPGVEYAEQTIAEILRVVFRLKNVRVHQASGPTQWLYDGHKRNETNMFITPIGSTSPWPGSMHLVYDS